MWNRVFFTPLSSFHHGDSQTMEFCVAVLQRRDSFRGLKLPFGLVFILSYEDFIELSYCEQECLIQCAFLNVGIFKSSGRTFSSYSVEPFPVFGTSHIFRKLSLIEIFQTSISSNCCDLFRKNPLPHLPTSKAEQLSFRCYETRNGAQ